MKIIAGAVLVIVIALLGARRTFTRVHLPLGPRQIYLTGIEYILVGIILGDNLLGLLDNASLQGLSPLLYLALGWVGLLFGIQLELPQINRFPRQYLTLAFVQALTTALICALSLFGVALLFYDVSNQMVYVGLVALGAMAIPTAQSSLALLQQELRLRGSRVMEMLAYVAGIDAILGLVLWGILFAYHRARDLGDAYALSTMLYFLASVGLGAVMGYMLHILTRYRCSKEELLLFTIGLVVFASGSAAYVGLSPLFVTAIAGGLIANFRGAKARILRSLIIFEKPFYIMLLLYGGAVLNPGHNWQFILLVTAIYIIGRILGKSLGGGLARALTKGPADIPIWIGLGLTSQGGMVVAMVVSFQRTFDGPIADTILFIVLTSIIVNELISPYLSRAILTRTT